MRENPLEMKDLCDLYRNLFALIAISERVTITGVQIHFPYFIAACNQTLLAKLRQLADNKQHLTIECSNKLVVDLDLGTDMIKRKTYKALFPNLTSLTLEGIGTVTHGCMLTDFTRLMVFMDKVGLGQSLLNETATHAIE